MYECAAHNIILVVISSDIYLVISVGSVQSRSYQDRFEEIQKGVKRRKEYEELMEIQETNGRRKGRYCSSLIEIKILSFS